MRFLSRTALFFFTSVCIACGQPNFIVVFTDDLGYGDIAGFGFPESNAPTPRLSKMAEEGVKLTRFMTPMPYCAPSRASLLTGRYPFHHMIVSNPTPDHGIDDYGLPRSEFTMAEMLKEGGYACYMVGKWHLGHKPEFLPTKQGFDAYYGILYSNDMRPVQMVENEAVVEYPVDQASITQKYTAKSVEYMREAVEAKRPFFLYLAHTMPHKPLAASAAFYTPETPGDLYADVIRELDWSVGTVLDEVKRLGVDEETLIIFTSDNGPSWGGSTGGLRGMKARSWDGGNRVPFIARWAGRIPRGITNPSLASTIDLMPTMAKLAGVKLPNHVEIDGKDIWPLLTDATVESPHPYFLGMKNTRIRTIHKGKWKLHVHPAEKYVQPSEGYIKGKEQRAPDGKTIIAPEEQYRVSAYPGLTTGDESAPMMLFDIEADPGEQRDLADEYPEVVERLKNLYDQVAAPAPFFEVPKSKGFRPVEGGKLKFWEESD